MGQAYAKLGREIVFKEDCLHARLFPCKIAFMQDFMQHAGGFLCIFAKMGPKSGPGGSKIDPGASPERPNAEKSGQKCTESFPRASRKHFFDFLGAKTATLGVQSGGFFLRNRSKGRSGSENGDFFCKNAEVQQTLCFASPNGSPHNPASTKIGQGG